MKTKKLDLRYNNWVFTCWDDEPPKYNETIMKYLCYEHEICPETGTPHWQGYVGFKNKQSLLSVVKKLQQIKPPHVEIMHGNLIHNEVYCSKENNLTKFGTYPKQGERTDIITISEMVRQGMSDTEIVNTVIETDNGTIDFGERWRMNYRGIRELRNVVNEHNPRFEKVNVVWIYGKTGKGKTRYCVDNNARNVSYEHGFFTDWDNAKTISFEEMRGQIPYELLLKITDNYKDYYEVNIKGGYKRINVDTIIFTSPYHPKDCYARENEETDSIDQFLRRITSLINIDENPLY